MSEERESDVESTVLARDVLALLAALDGLDHGSGAGFRQPVFESAVMRRYQAELGAHLQGSQRRLHAFHESSMELALCVSEVFRVLAELRGGNLDVRVGEEVVRSSDELLGLLGQELNHTIDDVRQRVKTIQEMNAELSALKDSLESMVRDRTLALEEANRDLREAHRKLQENLDQLLISERNASLGRLTAGIAHEMNSPLAAVSLSLTEVGALLGELDASLGDPAVTQDDLKEISGEMRDALGVARNAGDRVQQFVRSIRTQTRDLQPGERIAFDPSLIIKEALLLLGYETRRRNCVVEFEGAAGSLRVRGAPNHLAQIITNLVNNSMDALSDQAPRCVRVVLASAGEKAIVTVTDQGCGISPEVLGKIFDPLFTTKPYGDGTGLGLAIVHDLVTGQFGGTIHVVSEMGRGTSFRVELPLVGG